MSLYNGKLKQYYTLISIVLCTYRSVEIFIWQPSHETGTMITFKLKIYWNVKSTENFFSQGKQSILTRTRPSITLFFLNYLLIQKIFRGEHYIYVPSFKDLSL